MPRNHKPKPGARPYLSAQPDTLQKAYEELQQGSSERKVCEKYDFSRTKLRNYIKVQTGQKVFRPPGGQTSLSSDVERTIVDHLCVVSDWGFPFDMMDLRMSVKCLLDKAGVKHKKFQNNFPGEDWAVSFLKRHKDRINNRMCQNISKKRAKINTETINSYFDELEKTLEGIPPKNIINYDETNLTDDPGRKRMIFKRGTKYPERIMNGTKSSTSIMLAGSAAGDVLPLYVVYKSEHLWDIWKEGGPQKTRYNRSRSGWFDQYCFQDWFETVALPYCRRLSGKKMLVGDNLSSHFNDDIIEKCVLNNIAFVCLPPNSTHLCQPLDVAFFAPMKRKWREILTQWKKSPRNNAGTLPKHQFPKLLRKLMEELPNQNDNMAAGFRKCGIHPIDRTAVLNRLPSTSVLNQDEVNTSVSEVFIAHLQNLRQGDENRPAKRRRKRLDVVPGRSVGEFDNDEPSTSNPAPMREEPEGLEVPDEPSTSYPAPTEAEYLSDSTDSVISVEQSNDRNVFDALAI